MSIITEAPGWLILVCLLIGVVYAGALYFRDRFNRTYGKALAALLATTRFLTVSLLAFFLLKPLVKSVDKNTEKPIVVIAQDNSQSIVVGSDSVLYRTEYLQKLKELTTQLEESFEVRTYNFGGAVKEGIDSIKYNENLTDFSFLLDEVFNKFSGRNLGAIVVASDGLYNKGSNPVYSYKKLNVPVYTIALGDTAMYKDILLPEVAANRLAYLGNKFPVSALVEGRKAAGEISTLTVTRKGNTLYTEQIAFTGEKYFKTIDLFLDATEVGLQKYTITLSPVNNEVTTVNNQREVYIDVLDNRQKVLILAHAPHPDLAAIRDAITANEGYDVDVKLADEFTGNLNEFSLVLFHQLPAVSGAGNGVVQNALNQKIPALFIWGSQTDFETFNGYKLGYSLEDYRNNSSDAGSELSKGFSLFNLNEPAASIFKTMPPLAVPFGAFEFSPGAHVFLTQRLGQIITEKPLLSFNTVNENKVGLIAGEGIWRWRYTAFQQFETHDYFNEVITKIVQYLAAKEDKSLFRVTADRDFNENEAVMLQAEVYNESFEPIADREISATIKNEDGLEFNFVFSPSGSQYKLNAGVLPAGNYSYIANTTSSGKVLKETGEFSIKPIRLEFINTQADHRLMNQFARENKGEMFYPAEMNRIAETIKAKKEIVPITYETKRLNDLINYPWILALLVVLLATEWLLRKRAGTY